MAGAKALVDINKRLQQIRDINNLDFGGLDIVLTGDWYQLPPVLGTAMWKSTDSSGGFALYRRLNCAVELDYSHRHANDPATDQLCDRFLDNQPTQDDLIRVNLRLITATLRPPVSATVVVPDNNDRTAVNRLAFRTYCERYPLTERKSTSWFERGCIRVVASLSCPEYPTALNERTRRHVLNLKEQDIKRCGYLDLIVGCPLILTQNVEVSNGLANGTMSTLVDVVLNDRAQISVCPLFTNENGQPVYVHCVEASGVDSLILQHSDDVWSKKQHAFPSLPIGCFPLKIEHSVSTSVTVRSADHSVTRQVRVMIEQFQAVPAFAITGHKAQ